MSGCVEIIKIEAKFICFFTEGIEGDLTMRRAAPLTTLPEEHSARTRSAAVILAVAFTQQRTGHALCSLLPAADALKRRWRGVVEEEEMRRAAGNEPAQAGRAATDNDACANVIVTCEVRCVSTGRLASHVDAECLNVL